MSGCHFCAALWIEHELKSYFWDSMLEAGLPYWTVFRQKSQCMVFHSWIDPENAVCLFCMFSKVSLSYNSITCVILCPGMVCNTMLCKILQFYRLVLLLYHSPASSLSSSFPSLPFSIFSATSLSFLFIKVFGSVQSYVHYYGLF